MDKYFSISVTSPEKGKFYTVFEDITLRKMVEKQKQKLLENEQQLTEELTTSNEELQSTTEELHIANAELTRHGTELLKINKALTKSEDRFRVLADNIPNLAWMADANGWIFWYNKQWYDYTGTTLEEMQGWGWQKVHHPDYVDSVTEEWSTKLLNEEPYDNIFPLKGKDGKFRWFLTRITPIKDDQGKLQRWFGTNTDITEQIDAEELLKQSEQKYRRFFESNLIGVIYWNMENKIIDANDKFLDIVGYSRENLETGKINWSEMTPPEYQHLDEISVSELKATGINKTPFEKVYIHKNGTHIPILIAGAMLDETRFNGVAFVLDITERKKTEEEIINHQKVLDAINKVFQEYLKTDTLTEVVEKCLELAEDLTESEFGFFGEINENGRLDDRALSPPAWDICETKNAHELLKNMEIVSYWGRTIKEEKSQIVNDPNSDPDRRGLPDGHPPITSFLGVPLKEDEKTIGMIALANKKTGYNETDKKNVETLGVAFVEVFMRKKAEIDIEENLKNLAQSNKELEQFAYITSHDLREPLRMITSFLQLLERRYKDQLDKDANEFIGFAVDGAKRLDMMTNDLLKYSKITNEKRETIPVNFEHVLEHALANLKVQIEQNNAIITHDPLPTIKGDEQLKIQLFQNIIANAIKYKSQETPKIHISATKEKNHYLFSIKDNGIGMSPKHLEKIFIIFQRLHTREEYEGTGIGLAIAQKIVHQQGGKIWAESKIGKGTIFYFTVPIN